MIYKYTDEFDNTIHHEMNLGKETGVLRDFIVDLLKVKPHIGHADEFSTEQSVRLLFGTAEYGLRFLMDAVQDQLQGKHPNYTTFENLMSRVRSDIDLINKRIDAIIDEVDISITNKLTEINQ